MRPSSRRPPRSDAGTGSGSRARGQPPEPSARVPRSAGNLHGCGAAPRGRSPTNLGDTWQSNVGWHADRGRARARRLVGDIAGTVFPRINHIPTRAARDSTMNHSSAAAAGGVSATASACPGRPGSGTSQCATSRSNCRCSSFCSFARSGYSLATISSRSATTARAPARRVPRRTSSRRPVPVVLRHVGLHRQVESRLLHRFEDRIVVPLEEVEELVLPPHLRVEEPDRLGLAGHLLRRRLRASAYRARCHQEHRHQREPPQHAFLPLQVMTSPRRSRSSCETGNAGRRA